MKLLPYLGTSVEFRYLRGTWDTLNKKRNMHFFTSINYKGQSSSLAVHTEGESPLWTQKANLHLQDQK